MDSDNQPELGATLDIDVEEIDQWAFVEIYGHQKLAGRVTTRKVGTEVMFQVDIPKGDNEFLCSKLFGPKSIFSMTPTTEEWCRLWAKAAKEYQHEILPYIPETRQLESRYGYTEDDTAPNNEPD